MRTLLSLFALAGACGDVTPATDAAPPDDAPAIDAAVDTTPDDAPTDAPPIDACTPRILFAGGTPPADQGWSIAQSGSAEVTAASATETRLRTQTSGSTSGHLLLYRPGAVPTNGPFTIEVELQVVAASRHNQFDAGAAILGAFTPSFGMPAERGQMIYLDPAELGWADDSARAPAANVDGAFHVYRLAVDDAGTATVSRDGQPLLTRPTFVTNGTIALGDQTNDPNVDATILVRSVSIPCE